MKRSIEVAVNELRDWREAVATQLEIEGYTASENKEFSYTEYNKKGSGKILQNAVSGHEPTAYRKIKQRILNLLEINRGLQNPVISIEGHQVLKAWHFDIKDAPELSMIAKCQKTGTTSIWYELYPDGNWYAIQDKKLLGIILALTE